MENTEVREFTPMPRIGDPAPEFKAVTTQGEIHFPNDFKGKWVILFSHPADFTLYAPRNLSPLLPWKRSLRS
jgi:peroxiredoxin (alkyl hydroperoxide reductase subunit C)